jgi:hypothetical protein
MPSYSPHSPKVYIIIYVITSVVNVIGVSIYVYAYAARNYNINNFVRRAWTVFVWMFGLITTVLSGFPCYEPEHIYNIRHSHVSLAVDIIATTESLVAMFLVLVWCNVGVAKFDKFVSIIAFSGSLLSLFSSIGGLGESTNKFFVIMGDFKWGAIGFLIATGTQPFTMRIAKKIWGWIRPARPRSPPDIPLQDL